MRRAKEAAIIHDLSGFGRCSVSVVLPVLAAMGVRCDTLLTAYLSAQTAFPPSEKAVFLDLTEQMGACCDHWAELGASFDAIYSGFLGSERQIDLIQDMIKRFRQRDTLILVDPVMGDHGKLYSTYTPGMCAHMGALAAQADIITPNLTEAALLLGEPYEAAPQGEAGVRRWLDRLSLGGARSVIITGLSLAPGQVGAGCFCREDRTFSFAQAPLEAGHFPGTGDLFASVLLGDLLQGASLRQGMERAVGFIQKCAAATLELGTPPVLGVQFEPLLRELAVPRE